jgi:hypothetical protein
LLELFFVINNDLQGVSESSKQGIERIILDAIYNDGYLQNAFSADNIGNRTKQKILKRYLSGYDNIFTLNYDNNVEYLVGKQIYHLHGDYSVIADSENPINIMGDIRTDYGQLVKFPSEFKHCNCNALLNYSGELKYQRAIAKEQLQKIFDDDIKGNIAALLAVLIKGDDEQKQFVRRHLEKIDLRVGTNYHFSEFRTLTGELHIIGMSPSNDSHIFKCIDNSNLENVIFYYAGSTAVSKIPTKKPYTIKSVHDLWECMGLNNPKYNCNYPKPEEPKLDDYIKIFNELTNDRYSKDEIINEVNSTPQYEINRLSNVVSETLARQGTNYITTEKEWLNNVHEVTRIALREGIVPPALLMMYIMNHRN